MKTLEKTCIVDDDPILVYGMKLMMKQVEFCEEILVFNNGQEAIDGLLDMLNRGEALPSVIFLDLNMPVMDGWDFLESFVKIPNNNTERVTIYVVSSSINPADEQRAREYEVVGNYFVKPITELDLTGILQSA
ncbi:MULTISPECIES: response regulator [Robiginitalea]|uniref:Response regulator n=1 Tax=Robiginitalea biformata (strain ATCC BAA-864 / DSM 15991 / KCTC 12146 / HTCC2501) TaxID=313596 RepID=A4CIB0_ROBBH|nr:MULTISPECIES: response regulator [Robiginitalea]EAR16668.1 response regulator [Robiginitalea biformata HTCC2501]MDC6353123.1 response regulator [Robiginitalea sp. PM2]MDC6373710.1 response regulator [Robiginitalea sp. SP8]